MAGANPYGVSETDSIKSKRYSSNRAVGFAGGSIDKKTGNLVPASEAAVSGQSDSPIQSVEAEPIVQTQYKDKEAPKYLPDVAGVSHQTADPIDESIRQRIGEIDQNVFSRVICTELYRHRELPRDLYKADLDFTDRYLSRTTIRGYHWWGIPCVRLMRRHKRLRAVMKWIAIARAEEIGWLVGVRPNPNFYGRLIRLVVEPACFGIGLFVHDQDVSPLYGANYVP